MVGCNNVLFVENIKTWLLLANHPFKSKPEYLFGLEPHMESGKVSNVQSGAFDLSSSDG